MRLPSYTISARLVPDWKLPDPVSFVIPPTSINRQVVLGSKTVNPRDWKEPPHKRFANLGYHADRASETSDSDIKTFLSQYGLVDGPMFMREVSKMDIRGCGYSADATHSDIVFFLKIARFRPYQAKMREAWHKQNVNIFNDADDSESRWGVHPPFRSGWEMKRGRVEFHVTNLWDYMSILLARDIAEGRAKICQNPECPAPFFVASRNDAKYCERKCANTISVRNYRRRNKK